MVFCYQGVSHFQNLIYHSVFSYNFKTNEVEGVLKNNVEKLVEREGKLNDLEVKAQNLEEGTVIQNKKFHSETIEYYILRFTFEVHCLVHWTCANCFRQVQIRLLWANLYQPKTI